ncbi:peptidase M50 family protein isoform X2 [Wolffia australiana]
MACRDSLKVKYPSGRKVAKTLILLQQLACTFLEFSGKSFCNLPFDWLTGVPSLAASLKLLSLMDGAIMILSTLISVFVHEFGHAIAASSQGVQIEYVAIFLSIIFPGALVAINESVLQTLPSLAALRVYCAGVWHNFAFSAVCGLTLLLLPTALYPMYIHGESPVVLNVPPSSPLAGYLSSGDIILSLNGQEIHSPIEWSEKVSDLDPRFRNLPYNSLQPSGYCIPQSWIEEKAVLAVEGEKACPGDLVAFKTTASDGNNSRQGYCFPPQDVVKLKKCGSGCKNTASEDEFCLGPVQSPYSVWVEVSFLRSHDSECLKVVKNKRSLTVSGLESGPKTCRETLVFVGDISAANLIKLSAYYPRWSVGSLSIHLPDILERVFLSMLRVSASLGLLNSMPAFYLDGESMLEVSVGCVTWLNPPTRRKIFWSILFVGSSLISITVVRLLFLIYYG